MWAISSTNKELSRSDTGEGVEPVVDISHRCRGVFPGVDPYMKAKRYRGHGGRVRVSVYQWDPVLGWAVLAESVVGGRVVRMVRCPEWTTIPRTAQDLRKHGPAGRFVQWLHRFDASSRLRRSRDPVVVARDEQPAAVQLTGEGKSITHVVHRRHEEIAEV